MTSPDDGHTFRITMAVRGSWGFVGDPHHTDADYWSSDSAVEVRAWSLHEALLKAADLPLQDWFPEEVTGRCPACLLGFDKRWLTDGEPTCPGCGKTASWYAQKDAER